MKVALLNQRIADKIEKERKKTGAERFEGFLFKAFLSVFIIFVTAQTALSNSFVRSSFSDHYIEGEPLGKEVYLFVPCSMELKLINIDKCPDLKILINGFEKEAFENNDVVLELKDGDVVELDASSVLVPAKVQISAVSENISSILGRVVSVTDGINLVARVTTSH